MRDNFIYGSRDQYFKYSTAKKLVAVNPKNLSDEQLQKHIVQLRDYVRTINSGSPYDRDKLIDGGFFKSAMTASSTGISPKDVFLSQNLGVSLDDAIEEKKKRYRRDEVEEENNESVENKEVKWVKSPEVTPGGKRDFWFARTPLGRRWVVWDRNKRSWMVQGEGSKLLAAVNSVEQGKQFVEDEIKSFESFSVQKLLQKIFELKK